MPKPLSVTIPHRLTRQEARGRLQSGLGQVRTQLNGFGASVEERWTEDRMEFRLAVLAQTVTGRIDVLDDAVLVEVDLPWLLSMLAERIGHRIRRQGTLMLTKK